MDPDIIRVLRVVLIYALPVLLAVTLHEAAHGYAARLLGDDTAQRAGRITLNPLRHIDPVGTVLMPVLLYIGTKGAFTFGYAKPVPVNFSALRQPKRDMVWVAFAGPGSNLVQALLWLWLGLGLIALGMQEPFFLLMARAGVLVNLVMFTFNLFPVPPLDGGRVLMGLLPPRPAMAVARLEPVGFFIVVGLLVAGVVDRWWMHPILRTLLQWLRQLHPASFVQLMSLSP
jgi:Zn-dependent protease